MRIRTWLGWFSAIFCTFAIYSMASGVAGLVLSAPTAAWAQDEEEEAEAVVVEEESDEGADSSSTDADFSVLDWAFNALGWTYTITFLFLSFTFVALAVMNSLALRRQNIVPVELVEGFEAFLNEKRYQEAYELAKADFSFLGQVLSAGLAKLSSGYAQAIEAMQEVGEEEVMKLEHKLSYIALIGTLSPMVGLFGTVDGMIRSFQVIASSESTPKANELAKGISTALFTTLLGLAIAIPAIATFNILRNRVQRLTLEVGILSEGLMSRFQNVGQKKP